jgi:hypothetical protein
MSKSRENSEQKYRQEFARQNEVPHTTKKN